MKVNQDKGKGQSTADFISTGKTSKDSAKMRVFFKHFMFRACGTSESSYFVSRTDLAIMKDDVYTTQQIHQEELARHHLHHSY